jgi:hypothetical protein
MQESAKVLTNTNENSYIIPEVLDNYTTYYWRVVSRNSSGSTIGSVWRFTTIYTDSDGFEDFETGDFSHLNWSSGGDAGWVVQDLVVHRGTYSAQSGSINNNQTSELTVGLNIEENGTVSFHKKISSEAGFDKLFFYIDGVLQDNWSGEEDWSFESFSITSGYRTFKWVYEKNVSGSSGEDAAWLDCITFPAIDNTVYQSPENVQIIITENDVLLSWNASSEATLYNIYYSDDMQNFILLDTTPELSYTHLGGAENSRRFYYITAK